VFLKRDKDDKRWNIEYDETVYKIYDRNNALAGYFFPDYGFKYNENSREDEETIIETLNKEHKEVSGGEVLLPLVKLQLLDIEDKHVDLDYAYDQLEADLHRLDAWKEWMECNSEKFKIVGNGVYTSREDRNMLSIALGLNSPFILNEKQIGLSLKPLLDSLDRSGLL
jgi:hypothetical protein